jgi:hypothetical protein
MEDGFDGLIKREDRGGWRRRKTGEMRVTTGSVGGGLFK